MKKLILIILESSYATAAQDFYLAIIPATCTIFLNVNISTSTMAATITYVDPVSYLSFTEHWKRIDLFYHIYFLPIISTNSAIYVCLFHTKYFIHTHKNMAFLSPSTRPSQWFLFFALKSTLKFDIEFSQLISP